jgi:hypothetical protein
MGASLDFTLIGPGPWHAKGYAEFSLLCFNKKVDFEKIWGEMPETPPAIADIKQLILDDVNKKENWTSALPDAKQAHVQIKQYTGSEILLDPLGHFTVTQKIVPLGVQIQHYGPSQLKDGATTYSISSVTIANAPAQSIQLNDAKEIFAPAQWRTMTDAQKLSSPSFESMNAGKTISKQGNELYASEYISKKLGFEIIILHNIDDAPILPVAGIGLHTGLTKANYQALTRGGIIAENQLAIKYGNAVTQPLIRIKQEAFKVVNNASLNDSSIVNAAYLSKTEALDAIATSNPFIYDPYLQESVSSKPVFA